MAGRASEITSVVLDAIGQCEMRGGPVGASTLAELLAGSDTEKLRRLELDKLRQYGALRTQTKEAIVMLIESLVATGLAQKQALNGNAFWPVVKLTDRGWLRLKSGVSTPTLSAPLPSALVIPAKQVATRELKYESDPPAGRRPREKKTPTEPRELTGEAAERFEKLRAARLELAREQKWPPFVIFHDSVLKEIAYVVPRDLQSLRAIKGVGPSKAEKFGQQILDALSK
jgi:ATP-dependent DNA helicase RecQ